MSEEIRPGFYQDALGNWHPDRRKADDRRAFGKNAGQHDRRMYFRRKADRELLKLDHQSMIADALEEFAEQHNGHL